MKREVEREQVFGGEAAAKPNTASVSTSEGEEESTANTEL